MALQPLTQETKYYKAGKTLMEGEKVAGYYQNTHSNEYGPTHYFISKEDQSKFGLNGTARINGLIEKAFKPGIYAEITYLGKQKTNKGKDAHSFDIQVDSEDVFLVAKEEAHTDSPESTTAPAMTADDIPL